MNNIKWRTIVGLVLVYVAILLYPNYQWIWAILFLYWVIPDLVTGTTHFIERIERVQNPILYWIIVLTWLLIAVYILVEALIG